MNQSIKFLLFILSIAFGFILGLLYISKCTHQKPIYKTGKSWTITKPQDSTVRFNKAVKVKPKRVYYPVHHYHNDSLRWKETIDSLRDLLAIRVYLDTQTIGKAQIISYDSIQGNLLSKQTGCRFCNRDTTFIHRVDTVTTETQKDQPITSFGIQGGLYIGWNLSPIPGVYFGPGIGAGLNVKLKKK